jgi:hypothetical protein
LQDSLRPFQREAPNKPTFRDYHEPFSLPCPVVPGWCRRLGDGDWYSSWWVFALRQVTAANDINHTIWTGALMGRSVLDGAGRVGAPLPFTFALCPAARPGGPGTVISPEAISDGNRADRLARTGRVTMKIIVSALVALSFLAGAVAPAAAYSGSMLERLDKEGRGGFGNG